MKINIRVEECCHLCERVVHNHMICPACKRIDVGTESYCDILDNLSDGEDAIIECSECHAKFKTTNRKSHWIGDWEWEEVSDG